MIQLNDFIQRNQQAIDSGWDGDTGPAIRLFDRSSEQCSHSIGEQLTVRLDRKRTVAGVIIEAQPWRLRLRRRSAIVQAKVIMECGVNKARREFFVEKLPWSYTPKL